MCDIERIKTWMEEQNVTQAELAEKLHCGRSTLNRILSGKRALSASLAARMKELMDSQDELITAAVPDDVAKQLRAWADDAHSTIEQVLQRLLDELPKFRK